MPEDETTPEGRPPWASNSPTPQFIPATPPPAPEAPPAVPTAASPTAASPVAAPPGPTDQGPEERPRPAIASLASAVGGIIATFGLFALISSDDVADSRTGIIALSLLFVVIGVAITWVARSQRALAGGVAISALAVVPLFNALFQDPQDVLDALGDIGKYRNIQMGVLACLAAVWLLSYALGPGKRHAFFLGAGILALWLIPMTWFSLSATERALAPLNQLTSQADPFSLDTSGSGSLDPTGSLGDLGGDDGSGASLFGQQGDDHLPLKLGLTSLLFGSAFLALGGSLDRALRPRMATPFFAAAAITLWQAIGYLEPDLKVTGASLVALVLGCIGIWLGTRGGRRFTSWLGVAAASVAVVRLVSEALDDKPGSTGAVLTVVGLGILVGVVVLERAGAVGGGGERRPLVPDADTDAPDAPAGPASPPGPPPAPRWG